MACPLPFLAQHLRPAQLNRRLARQAQKQDLRQGQAELLRHEMALRQDLARLRHG